MNGRRTARVALLVLVLLVAQVGTGAVAAAPERGPSDPAEVETFLDGAVQASLETHDVPGATVAVVADGEVLLTKGYGYADLDTRRPVVAEETLFRVGSVTKLVTWTAVMQGVEDGRLSLDADVNTYLADSAAEVPDTYDEPVTLEHLGTHTAGFEDPFVGTFVGGETDLRPLDEALAANRPARVRPPGELTAYSNWGAALAGHVAAESAGTEYERMVERGIFEPLGMANSTLAQPLPPALADRLATGYVREGGASVPGDLEYVGIPPAGSMSATAPDMAAFMLAHLDEGRYGGERILRPETVRAMHEQHFTNHPAVNGMAYGFMELDANGEEIIGHWGDTEQFHSQLLLFPERDVGLFVAYNGVGGGAAARDLSAAFVDHYYPTSAEPGPDPDDGAADRASSLAGEYRSTRIPYTSWWKVAGLVNVVEVRADGAELTTVTPSLQSAGFDPVRWREVEPDVYREVGGDAVLAFRTDDGRATHVFYGDIPTASFTRLPFQETRTFHLWLTVAALLAGLSAVGLVLWRGGRRLWRREPAPPSGPRAARLLAAGFGLVVAAFLVGLAAAVSDPFAVFAGPPAWVPVVLALPWVVAALALALALAAALAWRDGFWGRPGRVHLTVVALLALATVWQLAYWRFL